MDSSTRALGYDLFKLIVAILLLILFFLLLSRPTAQQVPLTAATTAVPATETTLSTPSVTLDANPIAVPATFTSLSLTSTSIPVSSATRTAAPGSTDPIPSPTATNLDAKARTATPLSSPTATNPDTRTVTPFPSPTRTPVIESTPTSIIEPTAIEAACDAAILRSRLQPGMKATILRRLNFRSSPGIQDNWLRTNIPGTQVEVMGGPECIPHISGAYVWWQIKLPDGKTGWSAEGSIHGTFYFMEPIR
jgi:hypothetical protein